MKDMKIMIIFLLLTLFISAEGQAKTVHLYCPDKSTFSDEYGKVIGNGDILTEEGNKIGRTLKFKTLIPVNITTFDQFKLEEVKVHVSPMVGCVYGEPSATRLYLYYRYKGYLKKCWIQKPEDMYFTCEMMGK